MTLSFPPHIAFGMGLRMVAMSILFAIRRQTVDVDIDLE